MLANDILLEAAKQIDRRAEQRDLGSERSMARAVELFKVITGATPIVMSETEGWIFMVCLKLARASAGSFCLDDWLDAAAYCALTAECLTSCLGKSESVK